MARSVSKIGWKIVGGAAGAAAGSAASRTATVAYRKIRKADPPASPAHPETAWADAIGWAVLSGVAIGLGRLTAERVAARWWVKTTGSLPPGMHDGD
ncbi:MULTISPECIES: DUF4235 domain-containing protein [unclassified Frankia]|uniref:DUF4235 domain-containing protein n=1 Tax=unclassified Frankia TaxID=2632575 RepID=UPI001EF41ECC|nr:MULTISPECIES: DUF4235 domain-containing protein [unclassified Frankia]